MWAAKFKLSVFRINTDSSSVWWRTYTGPSGKKRNQTGYNSQRKMYAESWLQRWWKTESKGRRNRGSGSASKIKETKQRQVSKGQLREESHLQEKTQTSGKSVAAAATTPKRKQCNWTRECLVKLGTGAITVHSDNDTNIRTSSTLLFLPSHNLPPAPPSKSFWEVYFANPDIKITNQKTWKNILGIQKMPCLKVCVLSKFVLGNPDPQGIRMWNLWEVTRSWGLRLYDSY